MNDRQWRRDGHDHGAALARDLRLHAGLPALQQRPAYFRERSRAVGVARRTGGCLAGAAARTDRRRSQHGRSGDAQRLPPCGAGRRRMAAATHPARLPRLAASRRTAGACRSPRGRRWRHQSLHRAAVAPGQAAQRRHQGSAPRLSARRGLAQCSRRARRGCRRAGAVARRRAVLRHRRQSPAACARPRPASRRRWAGAGIQRTGRARR